MQLFYSCTFDHFRLKFKDQRKKNIHVCHVNQHYETYNLKSYILRLYVTQMLQNGEKYAHQYFIKNKTNTFDMISQYIN